MNRDDICRHEAAHCAAALLLGIPVNYVAVNGDGGYVDYEAHSHTKDGAFKRMVNIICAISETCDPDGLPTWPLDPNDGPDGERHDRILLKTLSDRLGLDEQSYRKTELAALNLACSPAYLSLVATITGTLDYRPMIGADLLDYIADTTILRNTEHGT